MDDECILESYWFSRAWAKLALRSRTQDPKAGRFCCKHLRTCIGWKTASEIYLWFHGHYLSSDMRTNLSWHIWDAPSSVYWLFLANQIKQLFSASIFGGEFDVNVTRQIVGKSYETCYYLKILSIKACNDYYIFEAVFFIWKSFSYCLWYRASKTQRWI